MIVSESNSIQALLKHVDALLKTSLTPFQREEALKIRALAPMLTVSASGAEDFFEVPKALRVLVVEDNAFNRQFMTRLLEARGYLPDVAASGADALTCFDAGNRYHVVLMDIRMSGMDGFQCARAIRALEREKGLSTTPIIACTSPLSPEEKEIARRSGMEGYQEKPVNPGALFSEMNRVIRIRSSKSEESAEESEWHLDRVLEEMGGDPELFCEIAELFLKDHRRQMMEIREGIEQKDFHRVMHVAHSLKGAISVFGKNSVYESAYQIEVMGRQQDLGKAVANWERLNELIVRFAEDLKLAMRQCHSN